MEYCIYCIHPQGERCNGTSCLYSHLHYARIKNEDGTVEIVFTTKEDMELYNKIFTGV